MKANFDSLGCDFSVHFSLSSLPGRDKVELLARLLDEFGLTQRIAEVVGEEVINKIWREQTEKAWKGSN